MILRKLLNKIKTDWFLFGIVLAISLARWWPQLGMKGGPLKPEITIKYFAVSIIFFNSGLSIKTEQLASALKQVKVHFFVQFFTFMFVPGFVYCLVRILYITPINVHLLKGLTVLSCMPPPVSSAVILTKAIGGNEAAAIFNSAFGSFLGIFVTPFLLLLLMGSSGDVSYSNVFTTLTLTVVVPIILGQFFHHRPTVKKYLEEKKPPFGQIGSGILLCIIYTTFCDTFGAGSLNIDAKSLGLIIALIISMQALLLTLTFQTANRLQYEAGDVVSIMFCSTHKSLTLGIPMLKIIYHGNPALSFLSIPLLVYHPTQILLGGLLVPNVKSWMIKKRQEKESVEEGTVKEPLIAT